MAVQTGYGSTTLDYLCCWDGVFVGIECKAGKGKVTPRQNHVMEAICRSWGFAFVVNDHLPVEHQMEYIANAIARS
jgi:hypothetical protein